MKYLDWRSYIVGKWLSPAHAVARPHGRRQPMEARRGQFHNASRREDGRSIVLQAHEAVGAPCPRCVHAEPHGSLPGDVFFPPLLQTPDAAVSVASLSAGAAGPALLLAPRPLTPPEPERRQICTARKRAAAAIIALIACFFCQAEISGGATILLKPPKTSE